MDDLKLHSYEINNSNNENNLKSLFYLRLTGKTLIKREQTRKDHRVNVKVDYEKPQSISSDQLTSFVQMKSASISEDQLQEQSQLVNLNLKNSTRMMKEKIITDANQQIDDDQLNDQSSINLITWKNNTDQSSTNATVNQTNEELNITITETVEIKSELQSDVQSEQNSSNKGLQSDQQNQLSNDTGQGTIIEDQLDLSSKQKNSNILFKNLIKGKGSQYVYVTVIAAVSVLFCCICSQCMVRLSKACRLQLNAYYHKKKMEKNFIIQRVARREIETKKRYARAQMDQNV